MTIGYGRYGAGESIDEKIAVEDVMIILEGQITVTSDAGCETAGPDEIIYMPKGVSLTIAAGERGHHRLRDLSSLAAARRVDPPLPHITLS